MPVKKTTKKTAAKAKAKKPAKKAAPKKKVHKHKKGQGYECRVCGYRIVVDEVCGCATEHLFLCCGSPMKKKRAAKKTTKKAAKKTTKKTTKKAKK